MVELQPEHRAFLRAAIERHYASNSSPYYLANLGKPFKDLYGDYRVIYRANLSEICRALEPEYLIVADPDEPQRIAIAKAADAKAIEKQLLTSRPPTQPPKPKTFESFPLERIHRAVVAAFLQEIPDGQRRFLSVTAPFHFRNFPRNVPLSDGYVEVENSFTLNLPNTAAPQLTPEQRQKLIEKITKWLELKKFPADHFYFTRRPAVSAGGGKTPLERLIEAQPEHIRNELLIPADIIKLLMG